MTVMLLRVSLSILGVHVFFSYGCGPSEYLSAAGECCPMCSLGMVVRSDCSGDSSTTCIPCPPKTFMSQPNGLTHCFQCKVCDKDQGLYLSRPCITINNAVCEILDGFHCMDYKDRECTFALKHRSCMKGERIKSPGTKNSDTVCEVCPQGFYSPLGINCTKWTDCLVKGEIQDKEGNSVEDVQCKPTSRERYGLIVAVVVYVSQFCWLAVSFVKENCGPIKTAGPEVVGDNLKHRVNPIPVQETSPDSLITINFPEENKEDE